MPNLSQFLCLTSTISYFTHLIFKSDLACCPCAFCFRSNLRRCVVARLFCGAVSRSVSLRDFSCVAVSRIVSLRGFSYGASHALCRCETFLAERSHALCRCEIYLRSNLTIYVVARFFCEAVSRVVSLQNFSAWRSYALYH